MYVLSIYTAMYVYIYIYIYLYLCIYTAGGAFKLYLTVCKTRARKGGSNVVPSRNCGGFGEASFLGGFIFGTTWCR